MSLPSDSLTQLQDKLDELAVQMYTTIGVLQRDARPVPLPDDPGAPLELNGAGGANADPKAVAEPAGFSMQEIMEMASSVVNTGKQIDALVDGLPVMEESLWKESLQEAGQKGTVAAKEMEDTLTKARTALAQVTATLDSTAQSRLDFLSHNDGHVN